MAEDQCPGAGGWCLFNAVNLHPFTSMVELPPHPALFQTAQKVRERNMPCQRNEGRDRKVRPAASSNSLYTGCPSQGISSRRCCRLILRRARCRHSPNSITLEEMGFLVCTSQVEEKCPYCRDASPYAQILLVVVILLKTPTGAEQEVPGKQTHQYLPFSLTVTESGKGYSPNQYGASPRGRYLGTCCRLRFQESACR